MWARRLLFYSVMMKPAPRAHIIIYMRVERECH